MSFVRGLSKDCKNASLVSETVTENQIKRVVLTG